MGVFRVLSSSSLGYFLYSLEDKSVSIHPFRGKVLHAGEKIIIGDYVTLDEKGRINSVLERKNRLKRPRFSNVDEVFVLCSLKEPEFSSYLLDKFLSRINFSSLTASIVLTKSDLLKKSERNKRKKRMSYYEKIGYKVYFIDAHHATDFDFPKLHEELKHKTVAFVGQTGVGKSSLLNSIDPSFKRRVDSLYVRSGRGRHTTKEIILLPFEDGFIFDTPGFSSFDLLERNTLDLSLCFPGFRPYFGTCFFKDCLHLEKTKGCSVLEAVKNDELSMDSYQNYCKILTEVKENEKWKKKPLSVPRF